jgi:hypothetical protein
MSRKLTSLIVGLVASLAFVASAMQGCGGSSSSSNQDVCDQACDRALACTPDAGAIGQQANTVCKNSCASLPQCSNEAAIKSKIQSCLAMQDCAAVLACRLTVPECVSTTGTGGTTGAGGTTGSGGTGGSGSGWTCAEASGACSCAPTAGGALASCAGTYNCCVSIVSGATQVCSCSNVTATADCTAIVSGLNGTKVGSCPP